MIKKNNLAWILVSLGLLGVAVPHIWFLVDMTQNLSTISHAVLELFSVAFILVGFILFRVRKK